MIFTTAFERSDGECGTNVLPPVSLVNLSRTFGDTVRSEIPMANTLIFSCLSRASTSSVDEFFRSSPSLIRMIALSAFLLWLSLKCLAANSTASVMATWPPSIYRSSAASAISDFENA